MQPLYRFHIEPWFKAEGIEIKLVRTPFEVLRENHQMDPSSKGCTAP